MNYHKYSAFEQHKCISYNLVCQEIWHGSRQAKITMSASIFLWGDFSRQPISFLIWVARRIQFLCLYDWGPCWPRTVVSFYNLLHYLTQGPLLHLQSPKKQVVSSHVSFLLMESVSIPRFLRSHVIKSPHVKVYKFN